MAAVDITKLKATEAHRWVLMHIKPEHLAEVLEVARRLVAPAAKARYQALSTRTGVPWWVIAVIHEREADQDWSRSLAQGDKWDRPSVHVPANRPAFPSWDAAGYDALVNCAPYAARWKDWSIGGTLVLFGEYNGLGYAMRGVPTPYDWADTDQYVSGKFTSDRHYDPRAVDHQIGCAALLKCMADLDPSIQLDPKLNPAAATEPAKPAQSGGWLSSLLSKIQDQSK
jgi:lysozyme family protein